jgi:hypothetical protein
MTKQHEIRSTTDKPTMSQDKTTVEGYAAVYNSYSQDLGGFTEIIRPGAFDRCLASKLPDTSAARDLKVSMDRSDIDGSSFAFMPTEAGDTWTMTGDKIIREITEADLFDVSPVTYPAYLATESCLRGFASFRESKNKDAAEIAARMRRDADEAVRIRQRQIEITMNM